MAALTKAVPSSLPSQDTAGGWLAVDPDPSGKGPVSTGPSEPISNPVDGTAPVPLQPSPLDWTEPELAEQAPDYFAESAFPHAGPWPPLPADGSGKEPFGDLPAEQDIPAGYYRIPLTAEGFAQRALSYPGHDAHSQLTDEAGWDQYTPSGRTAVLQAWEQDYHGVSNFWPVTEQPLARVPLARGGDQEIGGVVAQYGGLSDSGGNTAYVAPAPPDVTVEQPAQAPASTIPQWGF